jgi:ADP-ribosylglycohydrolase
VDDKNFPLFQNKNSRFTDDTVLTCATADAILRSIMPENWQMGQNHLYGTPPFASFYKRWAQRYPGRGYGSMFQEWVDEDVLDMRNPRKSYSNGCMMRCSPIAIYAQNIDEARSLALSSIDMTHNSPESARGVQSIVSAIYLAKMKNTKLTIKGYIEENFGHMLDLNVEQWRMHSKPSIRCNITAPQALVCFLESDSYESAVRNAVYTKGDTDTIAAIAGSIAEAYYGTSSIPKLMVFEARNRLSLEMISLINKFYTKIGNVNDQYKGFQL